MGFPPWRVAETMNTSTLHSNSLRKPPRRTRAHRKGVGGDRRYRVSSPYALQDGADRRRPDTGSLGTETCPMAASLDQGRNLRPADDGKGHEGGKCETYRFFRF